jgi:predicted dehydrogenase
MIRFGVVGTGWRTEFFLRITQVRPDLFTCVGVVTRDAQRAATWARPFGVKLYESLDEMLQEKPLFVVTSVPRAANPDILKQLAARGIPALSETPPAHEIAEMVELYRLVENGAKIAVAEQYHLQPHHAARIAFIQSGKLGQVTQAQISAAHGYHGTSLIRRYLGIGYEKCTITAHKFTSPIVKSPGRAGLPDTETIVSSDHILAYLNFGDRLGVFDFTGDQYFYFIRGKRILIRGERGEIRDDSAVYLQDHKTPIHVTFRRDETGQQGNMEGLYLRGIQVGEAWVYRNPLAPARLYDDEIAVGECLLKMAEYADGAEPFYPLAEACQDRYLDIKIGESIASGQSVQTETQVWAR